MSYGAESRARTAEWEAAKGYGDIQKLAIAEKYIEDFLRSSVGQLRSDQVGRLHAACNWVSVTREQVEHDAKVQQAKRIAAV